MRVRAISLPAALAASISLAACSGGGSSPTTAATTSPAATSAASTSASPSESTAASGATVEAKEVGSIGTVVVAGSNGMTVYTFTKDTKDSGESACTGGCIQKWPALTVDDGATPSAGAGATGTLGTITRSDDGSTQMTYNGLPLYFFSGDSAPGDANGVYTNWEAVQP